MENEIETCELYECNYSTKADSLTITFLNTDFYNHIKHELQNKYNFCLNINENGHQSTVELDGKKCVITLYFNTTLFIQGKLCKQWKREIYDELFERYCLIHGCLTSSSSTVSISPESSQRSPLIASLSRMVNRLRSPGKRTPLKEHTSTNKSETSPSLFTLNSTPIGHPNRSNSNSMSINGPTTIDTDSNACSPLIDNEETVVKRVQTKQNKKDKT